MVVVWRTTVQEFLYLLKTLFGSQFSVQKSSQRQKGL